MSCKQYTKRYEKTSQKKKKTKTHRLIQNKNNDWHTLRKKHTEKRQYKDQNRFKHTRR